jgi:hypothetical protein
MASTAETDLAQQPAHAAAAFAAALAAYNLAQRDRQALVATLVEADFSCQLAHSVLCAARDELLAADQTAPAIPGTFEAESYTVTGVWLPSLLAQVSATLIHARSHRDADATEADEAPACKRAEV